MRKADRYGLVVVAVTLLLGPACGGTESATTTTQPFLPSSAPATTAAPSVTTPVVTTVAAGPVVAEAGAWRLVVTAPTVGATIGPTFDLCYELTGPGQGDLAFDVNLVFTATGTPASSDHVAASLGRGSARVDVGHPDLRQYNMIVQALLNGQPISKLAVTIGVLFGSTPPAGCP